MITILLFGRSGQVGFELHRSLSHTSRLIAPDRTELDLTNADAVRNLITATKPHVIINAAGLTIVDDVEANADLAMQLNAAIPKVMAESAQIVGATLIHFSTTFVFDGTKREPYTENDTPNPINVYGQAKLAGERAIMQSCARHIILRANWVYSARRINFALTMLKLAREKADLFVVGDQFGSPTWAFDYANATAGLLKNAALLREFPGIYHLSAQAHCSRFLWAKQLIDSAKGAAGNRTGWAKLHPTTTDQYPLPAPRPLYTVTSNRKIEETFGIRIPVWEDRVDAFVRTLPWH